MHSDIKKLKPPQIFEKIPDYDFKHVDCAEFRVATDERGIECSMALDDRYFRSYGQSAQDVSKDIHYRIPDIVLWPKNHEEAEFIVKIANKFNVVIIPYGGKSSSRLWLQRIIWFDKLQQVERTSLARSIVPKTSCEPSYHWVGHGFEKRVMSGN